VKYIDQNASGNSSGGTGDGSYANPWLVNTMNDATTLVAAQIGSGDITFLFNRGKTYRTAGGASVNAPQVTAQKTCISCYGTGAPPLFTGYELCGSGWTNDGSGSYYKVLGFQPYWVRDAGGAPTSSETVYVLADSLANCRTTNNSWFYDGGTGRTYVRRGAGTDPSGLMESCRNAGAGVTVSNVDGCRVEGIDCMGFGMDSANSTNLPISANCTDTNECVIRDCGAWYGPKHLIFNIASGTSNSGGIVLIEYCRTGGCLCDGSGSATNLASYAAFGGNEYIFHSNRANFGGLPVIGGTDFSLTSRPKRGMHWYAHTGGGANYTAFGMAYRNQADTHSFGVRSRGSHANKAAYTGNRANLTAIRHFVIGEYFVGGASTTPSMDLVNEGWAWNWDQVTVPADFGNGPLMSTGLPALRGVNIGHVLDVDWNSATTGTTKQAMSTGDSNQADWDWAFCVVRNSTSQASTYFAWDSRDSSGMMTNRVRAWNCMEINIGMQPGAYHLHKNGAPVDNASDASITGGAVNCVFWKGTVSSPGAAGNTIYKPNFGSPPGAGTYWGYNSTTSPIDNENGLSAAPVPGTVPVSTDAVYRSADTSTMPFVVQWWMDSNGVARPMPQSPSRGSAQQSAGKVHPAFQHLMEMVAA